MENILQIENLSKTFGTQRAVDGLSFTVPTGCLLAFLGQNGAGKSTTINMLIGLLAPDGGTISYGNGASYTSFKDQIGVVFQSNIFDNLLTVEENLMLYGSLYVKDKAKLSARYAEIINLLDLSDYAKKRFRLLSGGQKRKAEIARALFFSPKILFLDEPTTGLDPKTRREVWDVVDKIRKATGMTVFLTTHYMEETADADRVIIIHKGKKICEGSPAELKAQYSYDRLLIVPNDAPAFEKKLEAMGLPLVKTADTYTIKTTDTKNSIETLSTLKDYIKFYESKKGSMDDVFLNVAGEPVKEEA